ncbi:AAA domain protein [Clostridium saccharobutylicum DSM 13864]|uniref:AAA domain protein n=1 Tax=Clostridium saccharobutylicum DSM 13864 TaxID=1345695 RepID=U5MW94_CLOSA|nr:AAA domain protein [Clostridium saccharobutylicum DSM 13864]
MKLKQIFYLGVNLLTDYGFYIKLLVIKGIDKDSAEIRLFKGLNVISGASDTGKTYIFECINFALGSKDVPRAIDEGYNEIYIEIETYKGEIVTIKRNLSDKKMFLYKCTFNTIDTNAPVEIKQKHDENKKNNISTILLNICNVDYKKILATKKGTFENFTFRDIAHLTMLNEESVISKASIIYSGKGGFKKTRNESVFKTIVTGIDDSSSIIDCDPTSRKIGIQAKIEIIDKFISDTVKEIEELEKHIRDYNTSNNSMNEAIDGLENMIEGKKQALDTLEHERRAIWDDDIKLKQENLYNTELIKRFTLLKENYLSDLERLDFIDEAGFYLGQLNDIKCPLCNGELKNGFEDSNFEEEAVEQSIKSERVKLKKQINDLVATINDLQEKILIREKEIHKLDECINKIDKEINDELKPIIDKYLSRLDSFLQIRDYVKKKEYAIKKIEQLKDEKEYLSVDLSKDKYIKPVVNEITDVNYEDLCEIMKNILSEWKLYESVNVTFDKSIMDFIINNKHKENYGKGYRALINTAFVIAIMKYSIKFSLPHSKLVIIDSPLTTYKEKDKEVDNNEIKSEVKQMFYQYLSKESENMQIIMLDNVDPNIDNQSNINYYHFSKNKEVGRYGFLPI